MYPKLKKFLTAQMGRLNTLDEQEKLSTLPNIRPEVDEYGQPTGRSGFATIYENMASNLLRNPVFQYERERIENVLTEDTVSTAIAAFSTFALPLVRRIMRSLVTLNSGIVSLQPMRQPQGQIFFMKRLYSSAYEADGITQYDDVADHPDALNYAQTTEKGTIREMQIKLDSKSVSAISMKLQTGWTLEAAQNLQAYHNLDYESEIKSLFTDEIQLETDRYILSKLLAGAGYNVNWVNSAPVGDVTTADKKAYYETLYSTAIVAASMRILEKFHIPAGWAIMSPTVLALLMRCESFRLTADINSLRTAMGISQVGTINGQIKVLVDPAFPTNKILMGAQAVDWARTAGIYAPFLPLTFSPTYVSSADDFSQLKSGAMSRFWAGIVGNDENAVTSDGLATITIASS